MYRIGRRPISTTVCCSYDRLFRIKDQNPALPYIMLIREAKNLLLSDGYTYQIEEMQ